jgi:hypothetical protein
MVGVDCAAAGVITNPVTSDKAANKRSTLRAFLFPYFNQTPRSGSSVYLNTTTKNYLKIPISYFLKKLDD